jgi:hypothetical protein
VGYFCSCLCGFLEICVRAWARMPLVYRGGTRAQAHIQRCDGPKRNVNKSSNCSSEGLKFRQRISIIVEQVSRCKQNYRFYGVILTMSQHTNILVCDIGWFQITCDLQQKAVFCN